MNNEKESLIIKEIISIPIEQWQFVKEPERYDKAITETRGMTVEFYYGKTTQNNYAASVIVDGLVLYEDMERSLTKFAYRLERTLAELNEKERVEKLNQIYNKIFPQ